MPGAREKLEELKVLQGHLENLAKAEDAAATAKAAYQEDQSDENKEAHRAASQMLNDARETVRYARTSEEIGDDPDSPDATVIPKG